MLRQILTPTDEIKIVIDNRTGQAQMQCTRVLPIPMVMSVFSKMLASLSDQMAASIGSDPVLQEKLGFKVEAVEDTTNGPAS